MLVEDLRKCQYEIRTTLKELSYVTYIYMYPFLHRRPEQSSSLKTAHPYFPFRVAQNMDFVEHASQCQKAPSLFKSETCGTCLQPACDSPATASKSGMTGRPLYITPSEQSALWSNVSMFKGYHDTPLRPWTHCGSVGNLAAYKCTGPDIVRNRLSCRTSLGPRQRQNV